MYFQLNIYNVVLLRKLYVVENNKLDISEPDTRLIGKDGSRAVNSLLLIVHSSLLKEIIGGLGEQEVLVIVPDDSKGDVDTLVAVINGEEELGYVAGGFLDRLGMDQFKLFSHNRSTLEGEFAFEGQQINIIEPINILTDKVLVVEKDSHTSLVVDGDSLTPVADNSDQIVGEDLSDDEFIVSEVILDGNLIINGTLGDDNIYIR